MYVLKLYSNISHFDISNMLYSFNFNNFVSTSWIGVYMSNCEGPIITVATVIKNLVADIVMVSPILVAYNFT
jgi:hypothetical protein